MAVKFMPILPVWIIVLVAAALVATLAYGSVILMRKQVPARWVSYLGALRLAAVGLLLICLLRPIVSYTIDVTRSPDLVVLVDTSASMAGDEPTRLAQTLEQIDQSGLADSLKEKFDVQWYVFDQEARRVQSRALARTQADGSRTDLAESLRSTWSDVQQRAWGTSSGITGAVSMLLITDGNDQGSEDVVAVARKLGFTIDTLAAADVPPAKPSSEVHITDVHGPRRVMLGSQCRFRMIVSQEGAAGVPLVVRLSEEGQNVATGEFSFEPGEPERQLELSHRPSSSGAKHYTVEITPVDGASASLASRPFELTVNVLPGVSNVLILEDNWRWEFRYLRRVLQDDPSFSFTAFLARGPGTYMQFAEPKRLVKLGGFPQSRAELEWFDILVLGDVEPQHWPPSLAPAINHLVVKQGKSLVVIAGPNLARMAQLAPIEALLPVVITPESAVPVPGPIAVTPSPEGAASSLFFLPESEEGRAAPVDWNDLPAMDQIYVPQRKKPAATVLAEADDPSGVGRKLIVMAEHTVGRGRVLYVGTDTLWKWQMLGRADEAGNTAYRYFWQQALRAMTPTRAAGRGVDIWLETDRSRYRSGETVRVSAEIEGATAAEEQKIEGHTILPDGRKVPLTLLADPVAPHVLRDELIAPSRGHYQITATMLSEGKMVSEVRTTFDVDDAPAETSRVRVNKAMLQYIASGTGGQVVDPADPRTWPGRESTDQIATSELRTVDLWSSFLLPVGLVLLLGFDWLVRLLRGFV